MPNHVHCIIILGDYDFDNGISSTTDAPAVEKIHEFSQNEFSRNGIFRNEFSQNELSLPQTTALPESQSKLFSKKHYA